MLIAVTDHAAERFRQRVHGSLSEKADVQHAVDRALRAGRVHVGSAGEVLVRDVDRCSLIYVCRRDGEELIVITLWEEGEDAKVPRRFTDALRPSDHLVQ